MAKNNIHFEKLLPWDKYNGKGFEEVLPSIYENVSNLSKEISAWYWESVKIKRWAALSVLGFTFVFLVIGTLFPIFASIHEKVEVRLFYTQIGIIALALAGLLQAADRTFGWSSGWLRYIATVTSIETLTRQFELDWASYIVSKNGNSIGDEDKKPLFDIAKRFQEAILKLKDEETDKWIIDFNSNISLLNDLIKSQRNEAEKTLTLVNQTLEAQRKAEKNGSIELTLVHKNTPTQIKISVDGKLEAVFTGTSWVKTGLTPGQHEINISSETPENKINKMVEVPANGVARERVEIP